MYVFSKLNDDDDDDGDNCRKSKLLSGSQFCWKSEPNYGLRCFDCYVPGALYSCRFVVGRCCVVWLSVYCRYMATDGFANAKINRAAWHFSVRHYCSGGFRGGGASRLRPPFLWGDGLTPSLTVLLIFDNGAVLWRHHRQFISANMLKMVLRIFKIIVTNDFPEASKCTKFVFGRAPPQTNWWSLQRSPDSSWFKGGYF